MGYGCLRGGPAHARWLAHTAAAGLPAGAHFVAHVLRRAFVGSGGAAAADRKRR